MRELCTSPVYLNLRLRVAFGAMCDLCGCRRIPEIAELGAQHERIETLAAAVMEALSSESANLVESIIELREALSPHVSREEQGIFTQARQLGIGAESIGELTEDHRRFAQILAEPEKLDRAELVRLVDDLIMHITIEEFDLFPTIAEELEPGLMTVPWED